MSSGFCGSGVRRRLALRLAQGFRKLPGQRLQAGRQGGCGRWKTRRRRRLGHGAVNRAMRQRFQDAKGPRNHAKCKGLP